MSRLLRAILTAVLAGLPTAVAAQRDSVRVVIRIEGIDGPLARNARAMMALAREAEEGPLAATTIPRLYHRGEEDIARALRPFGYYQPRIASALEAGEDFWTAHYMVDPGPVVRVRTVDVTLRGEGRDRPEFQRPVRDFPLAPGDTMHDPRYESGKLALLAVASDSGYLDADFDTSAVLVDRARQAADIRIRFTTGPRFRFGPVEFEQSMLKESLLRTRVPFRQGDFYRHDKLLQLQTTLSEDPYFARVEVIPLRQEAEGLEVPIRVSLTPRPRWTHEFGGGYGTDTGPRVRANGMWRWVNSRGHYADAEALVSLIEQRATTRYNIPAVLNPTGVLTWFAGFSRSSINPHRTLTPFGLTSRTLTAGVRLSRHRIGWRETLSLAYQRTGFEIGTDSARTALLIPAASWERTRSDRRILPRRGIRTRLEIQGSRKEILSDASFLQIRAGAKMVLGLMPRMRILARGEIGRTFTSQFSRLPPNLRFFTGGDESVRGYRYLALAPRDTTGQVLGGSRLLAGSAELDYQVTPRWVVAAFTDAGNVLHRFSLAELRQSVGVGLRFVSPIGMIRLDAAIPLDHLPGMGKFRLHFSMGPDL